MNGEYPEYEGRLLVFQGPSGCGKNSIIKRLVERYPKFYRTVSSTTRPPRPGEVDGEDYYFIDRETFLDQIRARLFAESNEYSGEWYGTHMQEVKPGLRDGRALVTDVDINGVSQLVDTFGPIAVVYVQVVPPSDDGSLDGALAYLEQRITSREPQLAGTAKLAGRLEAARRELLLMDKEPFSTWKKLRVTNDNLDAAVNSVDLNLVDRRDEGIKQLIGPSK
jgi:guanylate kinase